MANKGTPSTALLTPDQFLANSKAKISQIVTGIPVNESATTSIRIPSSGLGHCLWVTISGSATFNATTITGGTFPNRPNVSPWSIIKRVKLYSNNAFNLRDMSGWGWYKWLRCRYGLDPTVMTNTGNYDALTTDLIGAVSPTPGSAPVGGTTYSFRCTIPMPLSFNDAGELGLIVLQQNSTFYNLDINWGSIVGTFGTSVGTATAGGTSDFFGAITGTGQYVSNVSFTVDAALEWFEVIPGIDNLVSMFMSVNDQTQALVQGRNIIIPPVNDYYTMLVGDIWNNGAPIAYSGLSNLTFKHSGNVYDYQESFPVNHSRWYWKHNGVTLPDTSFGYDFGVRRGILLRRDTVEAFNDLNVTDLQITFDNSVTPTGNNGVNLLMESLRAVRQG